MLSYLAELTLVWAAGLAIYFALLRRLPAHGFNRAYLLVVLAAGISLPLVPTWGRLDVAAAALVPSAAALREAWLPQLTVVATQSLLDRLLSQGWQGLALGLLYGASVGWFAKQLLRLARLHGGSRVRYRDGVMTVREVAADAPIAPCSFGATVYVHDFDALDAATRDTLLRHERAHYELAHSVDVVLVNLAAAAFAFHPLLLLLRRELRLVHEYQADARTLAHVDARAYRRTLLSQQLGAPASAFAAAFSHSPLQLRFQMMSSSFRQNQTWRPVLAAALALLIGLACTKEEVSDEMLADIAAENTASAQAEHYDSREAAMAALVADGTVLLSVDTITMINPADMSETVEIVRNYTWASSGEPIDLSQSANVRPDVHGGPLGSKSSELIRNEPVYFVVDYMPRFPSPDCATDDERCAQANMLDFIYNEIKYPAAARDAGVEGTAAVSFVVGRDGELIAPRIMRSVSPEIDAEVLRLVAEMPAWTPGRHNGQPVQVRFNLPVKFKLN